MKIETSISSNQSMANVLEDGSQIDVQVQSTQPPDPRDIPRISGKRKGTQIPPNKRRKFSQLGIIQVKRALEHAEQGAEMLKEFLIVEQGAEMLKMLKANRNSSSTDDSD